MKHFFKYLSFWVLVAACDSGETLKPADSTRDYFPLRTGQFQIYAINEIRYQQGLEPETLAYELKTEVVDSFANTAGGTTYVIYRSTRDNPSQSWKFVDTWSVRNDDNQIVIQEGNTAYMKLVFPLSKKAFWDGNRFNNLEEDEYEVKAFDEPLTVGGTTFEKTLTIEQEFNDDPIVYTDIRSEVYARGVGLVYKETTQLVFCQNQNCNSNELIETGVVYKQEIREYGNL